MTYSLRSRCCSRGALVTTLCVALASLPEAAAAQTERDGFYAGLQLGVALPAALTTVRTYVSHPTRCDTLLYPLRVSPPADDPACRDSRPGSTSADFDDVDHEAVYDVVRSHAGVLADGVTPFNNELEFSGTGYQALTVNLKYHF